MRRPEWHAKKRRGFNRELQEQERRHQAGEPFTKPTVRFTFPDGSAHFVSVDLLRRIREHQLGWLHGRKGAPHGKSGGRPHVSERPSNAEIDLRFQKRLASSRGNRDEARAWLVKKIAGECSVDERTARTWINEVIGPRSAEVRK